MSPSSLPSMYPPSSMMVPASLPRVMSTLLSPSSPMVEMLTLESDRIMFLYFASNLSTASPAFKGSDDFETSTLETLPIVTPSSETSAPLRRLLAFWKYAVIVYLGTKKPDCPLTKKIASANSAKLVITSIPTRSSVQATDRRDAMFSLLFTKPCRALNKTVGGGALQGTQLRKRLMYSSFDRRSNSSGPSKTILPSRSIMKRVFAIHRKLSSVWKLILLSPLVAYSVASVNASRIRCV